MFGIHIIIVPEDVIFQALYPISGQLFVFEVLN